LVILGASLTVAGIFFSAYLWITTADAFTIALDKTKVEGNERLSTTEIVGLLGLDEGANLFSIDSGELAQRLESHPWIASAAVERDLPNALLIRVEEFETAAAVDLGGLYLVNHEGSPFKRASQHSGDLDDVVIITGLSREEYLQNPPATEARIAEAISILRTYWKDERRPRLGELHLSTHRGVTLIT
jgi:cell division protein FtsQ